MLGLFKHRPAQCYRWTDAPAMALQQFGSTRLCMAALLADSPEGPFVPPIALATLLPIYSFRPSDILFAPILTQLSHGFSIRFFYIVLSPSLW